MCDKGIHLEGPDWHMAVSSGWWLTCTGSKGMPFWGFVNRSFDPVSQFGGSKGRVLLEVLLFTGSRVTPPPGQVLCLLVLWRAPRRSPSLRGSESAAVPLTVLLEQGFG